MGQACMVQALLPDVKVPSASSGVAGSQSASRLIHSGLHSIRLCTLYTCYSLAKQLSSDIGLSSKLGWRLRHLGIHSSPGFCRIRLQYLDTRKMCQDSWRNSMWLKHPSRLLLPNASQLAPSLFMAQKDGESPLSSPCHHPHHRTFPSPEGQKSARLASPRADQLIDSQLPRRLALLHLSKGFHGCL